MTLRLSGNLECHKVDKRMTLNILDSSSEESRLRNALDS